jgi:hypothetical protein
LDADVALIAASGIPVLCFDTCTVLDLMRDPTQEAVKAHERRGAMEILTSVESANKPVLLVAEQVQREFSENVGRVEEETRVSIQKLKKQIARIDNVVAVYGAKGTTNLDHLGNHVSSSTICRKMDRRGDACPTGSRNSCQSCPTGTRSTHTRQKGQGFNEGLPCHRDISCRGSPTPRRWPYRFDRLRFVEFEGLH